MSYVRRARPLNDRRSPRPYILPARRPGILSFSGHQFVLAAPAPQKRVECFDFESQYISRRGRPPAREHISTGDINSDTHSPWRRNGQVKDLRAAMDNREIMSDWLAAVRQAKIKTSGIETGRAEREFGRI